jgi:hypothetical protein
MSAARILCQPMSNPDPKTGSWKQAQAKAENEVEGNKSIAQLLSNKKEDKDEKEDEKSSKA